MPNRPTLLSTVVLLGLYAATVSGQQIRSLNLSTARGLEVTGYVGSDGEQRRIGSSLPLFTCTVNDSLVTSLTFSTQASGDSIGWRDASRIAGSVRLEGLPGRGVKALVTFRNISRDTLQLANVVPLGEARDHVFIKAFGPQSYQFRLSRSCLFRPGLGPIGVVLPDNAWEMGFCDVPFDGGRSLAAIARRLDSAQADLRRFRAVIPPGGWVQYVMYIDDHAGDWRIGLRMMFQDRWIYDLDRFDTSLLERKDLSWIRHSYLLLLQFAWDQQYYDAMSSQYGYEHFLTQWDGVLGGFDAFMIWPTWPRLGLDQRSQWDMYRDLPGGLRELRRQADFAHRHQTRYFIAYNPWDESTRKEDHIGGMEEMLRTIDADGVVLDTWGESRKEFQAAADRVKPGVILYSEGMAVPKEMPGIVAGRVHDAIYMPPPLNLNKFIKPDFAIFRVIQLAEGRIHREIAVAFFNGYGSELNIMRPGRPDWIEEELTYLGRTTRILRENSSAFSSRDWSPLMPTAVDSIWVNQWRTPSKTLYTIYNLRPDGFNGPLFEGKASHDVHFISLWHNEEIEPVVADGASLLPVSADGFSRAWLGSRREGSVDCIAQFPRLLSVELDQDTLTISASRGDSILVWGGTPSYNRRPARLPAGNHRISLLAAVGKHEEKFVVQLFEKSELTDERVVALPLATPRPISRIERTPASVKAPEGMVAIPAGTFAYITTRSFLSPNEVIPYPRSSGKRTVSLTAFFMDRYPVTNGQFHAFIVATGYRPKDTTNYLKHWVQGMPPRGREKHPVVYVDRSDALAYARWAAKRLPTEIEWQYAAQGTDGRKYPWGSNLDSTRCNTGSDTTTPVDAFPMGRSPFGVEDLVGNVWQLTNDLYDNGTFYFAMIRGGSYYNPQSSWWYVQGGPQPVDNPQILLLAGPGLDRCATVGFRCVKDAGR
jgi:iron(II)-dependent oxidoreductase